jgi:hypothetical protein
VARQLGYGEESVRSWVKQADIDEGRRAGTTTSDAELIKGCFHIPQQLLGRPPRLRLVLPVPDYLTSNTSAASP